MKNLFSFAVMALLMLASCTNDNKYTINGAISGNDGKTVYLQYQTGDSMVTDSAVIADGKFMFQGELDRPYRSASLLIGNIADPYSRDIDFCGLSLEPGKITVNAEGGKLMDAIVEGGKTQKELNELNALLKPMQEKFQEFNAKYYELTDDAQRDSMNAAMEPVRKEYAEAVSNFYKTHTDSYLAPNYLSMDMGQMSYEDIKACYDAFSEDVKRYGDRVEEVKKELDALESIQPGHEAPDFTAQDINGEQFTLSALKGKVVILDFWASWCKPCRASNPHMIALYKKYHDKGLELVYVSDDDSEPDKWRKAVEEDGLKGDGFHHVLRGLKWDKSKGLDGMDHSNDISDKYAIHFLPTKYLIDREGRMVCKIDEGQDNMLDEKLKEIFGF